MAEYEVSGIKELSAAFEDVIQRFSYESEKKLQQVGNKFKKAVRDKTPSGKKDHRRKLNKSYKTEIVGFGKDIQLNFWSTAPHFHLVERGHKNVSKSGKDYGFTPGVHMVEKTVMEFETVVPQEAAKFIETIAKKME